MGVVYAKTLGEIVRNLGSKIKKLMKAGISLLDLKGFHKSTTRELLAIKDKVRNLVKHHGEDGRFKEIALRSIIRRNLPKQYTVGTGFVVRTNSGVESHEVSSQIDLIIHDNSYPLLFEEGDFLIVSAESVRAIVEVKTNLQNTNIGEVIQKNNKLGEFISKGKKVKDTYFFNGIFSYEGHDNLSLSNCETLKTRIRTQFDQEILTHHNNGIPNNSYFRNYLVNHVSINDHLFIKYDFISNKIAMYKIEELSFAYFVSNLIYFVTNNKIDGDKKLWFPEDKELNRIGEKL